MVANAPLVNGDANPFIDEGRFYYAGRGDWNPWASCFPGDDGLVEAQAFKDLEKEVLKRGVSVLGKNRFICLSNAAKIRGNHSTRDLRREASKCTWGGIDENPSRRMMMYKKAPAFNYFQNLAMNRNSQWQIGFVNTVTETRTSKNYQNQSG